MRARGVGAIREENQLCESVHAIIGGAVVRHFRTLRGSS